MSKRKNLLLAGLMTPSLALGPQAGVAPAAAAQGLVLAQAAPQGFDFAHEKRSPPQSPRPPAARPAPTAPPAAPFHPAPIQHSPAAPPPEPRPAPQPAPYPGAGVPPMAHPQMRAAPPREPRAPAIIQAPQQAAPIRRAPPPHAAPMPAVVPTPRPSAERPPAPAVAPSAAQRPSVSPSAPPAPRAPSHPAAPPANGADNLPPTGPAGAPAHLGGPHSAAPPVGNQGGNFLPSAAPPGGGAPQPNSPPPGGPADHAGAGGRFLPPGGSGAVPPATPSAAAPTGMVPSAAAPAAAGAAHIPPQAGGAHGAAAPAPPLVSQPAPPLASQPAPPPGPPPAPPHGGGPRVSPAAAAAIGAAAGLVGGFVLSQPGAHRLDDVHARRQQFERDGVLVVQEPGRTIVREGGGAFIRHDENERFRELGGNLRSERHGEEFVSVYARRDGGEVLTYTDANGVLLRRLRRFPDGREIILIDNGFRGPPRGFAEEVVVLPPPPVEIAPDAYVVDYGAADERLIYETLTAPPLAPMPRRYTLDEIRYSPSLRAYTRSVDIDTINFDTGSWAITPDQAQRLVLVAEALNEAIKRNPAEVFLIEGHTDAVGPDVDNLSLSDRRAQAVATILSRDFGVPPENLTTQGYGEQYLKVRTQGPSRENRRVTVRRITPLLSGPQAETHRR